MDHTNPSSALPASLRRTVPIVVLVGLVCCFGRPVDRIEAEEKPMGDAQDLLKQFMAEFVPITPGEGKFPAKFRMGTGDDAREVTMTEKFSIAKYEVPQNLYEKVMGKNPSVWGGPRNSVEMMSWREAVQFCGRATAMLKAAGLIKDNQRVRLPTEAEWEYCCRGGTTTDYSFGASATADNDAGNKASLLDPYGWHTGNAAGNDPPVGALKPNPWGLYDVHGYLWEYVADSWHPSLAAGPKDSSAWDSQAQHALRVIRGGSWRDHHRLLKSDSRWPLPDHVKSDAIGFRCVLETVD